MPKRKYVGEIPPPPKKKRLPDLTMAIWLYWSRIKTTFALKQYDECYDALESLNALLPPEYRIKIKSKVYRSKKK